MNSRLLRTVAFSPSSRSHLEASNFPSKALAEPSEAAKTLPIQPIPWNIKNDEESASECGHEDSAVSSVSEDFAAPPDFSLMTERQQLQFLIKNSQQKNNGKTQENTTTNAPAAPAPAKKRKLVDSVDSSDEASEIFESSEISSAPKEIWRPAEFSQWPQERRKLWENIKQQPEKYYYYFLPPGLTSRAELPWAPCERRQFLRALQERSGPPKKSLGWGFFSFHVFGRTGQECEIFYKTLVKEGGGLLGTGGRLGTAALKEIAAIQERKHYNLLPVAIVRADYQRATEVCEFPVFRSFDFPALNSPSGGLAAPGETRKIPKKQKALENAEKTKAQKKTTGAATASSSSSSSSSSTPQAQQNLQQQQSEEGEKKKEKKRQEESLPLPLSIPIQTLTPAQNLPVSPLESPSSRVLDWLRCCPSPEEFPPTFSGPLKIPAPLTAKPEDRRSLQQAEKFLLCLPSDSLVSSEESPVFRSRLAALVQNYRSAVTRLAKQQGEENRRLTAEIENSQTAGASEDFLFSLPSKYRALQRELGTKFQLDKQMLKALNKAGLI